MQEMPPEAPYISRMTLGEYRALAKTPSHIDDLAAALSALCDDFDRLRERCEFAYDQLGMVVRELAIHQIASDPFKVAEVRKACALEETVRSGEIERQR